MTVRRVVRARVLWRVLRESRRPGGPGIRERLGVVPRMGLATLSGRYPELSRARIGLFALAALYLVSPVDVIPEALLLGVGLVDDVAVAAWLLASLLVETDRFLAWEDERARVVPGQVVHERAQHGR